MSFSQKSHGLVPGSGRAHHTIAALWLLLKGKEGAASWSDICRCPWGDRSPAGERQWMRLLLTLSCPVSFSARCIPSAELCTRFLPQWQVF